MYIDFFVLPIAKNKVAAYRKMAAGGAKAWLKHGALQYVEAIGDDLKVKGVLPFTKLAKTKPNETVVVAYIVFKSKKHRDRVNAKVMADPEMTMPEGGMPFDLQRMAYGGFKPIVKA